MSRGLLRMMRVAGVSWLVLNLGACYRWQVSSLELQRRAARPEKLRLLLTNGEEVVLENGVVTADSVVGAGAVALPADRVAGMSARRLDRAITTFLALGLVVPVVAIVAVTTTGTCGAGAAPSC